MRLYLLLSLLSLSFATSARAADTPSAHTAPKPSTYLIVIRLPPRLHADTAWTDADKAAVSAHFQRLKAATEADQVILAGRTPEAGDKTMGLVVFTAADEPAARAFMQADPCVAAGVMLGELRPFSLTLLRR